MRRRVIVGSIVAVALVATGGTVLLIGGAPAHGVAVLGADDGIAIDGRTLRVGDRIVDALRASGDLVEPGEHPAVTVRLPADLTASVVSAATPDPHRTSVRIDAGRCADPALADAVRATVAEQTRLAAVDRSLAPISSARSALTGLQLSTQILAGGVSAAKDGAAQFGAGVRELTDYLNQAKDGSGQLAAAITGLRTTVDGATGQADELAASLSATGATVGSVRAGSAQLTHGLDEVIPRLRALPVPDAAATADRLTALRDIARQLGTSLDQLDGLLGTGVSPDTELGTLLTTVVDRLRSATGQLDDGAGQLATGLDQLAGQGGHQLADAATQLDTGATQLQQVSKGLVDQVNKGTAALPTRGTAATAASVTDPVDVATSTARRGFTVSLPCRN